MRQLSMLSLGLLMLCLTGEAQTLTPIVFPQYIEGYNSGNTNRIPFAFRAQLSGLSAGTTYRFYNQFVTSADTAGANGAGNCIFAETTGTFIRTSGPSLSTSGKYGTFTTDAAGTYEGWFVSEPTGNARFVPGRCVFVRINLNDGASGTAVATRITSSDSIRVVKLDSTVTDSTGTGLYCHSSASAMNFMFVYDNVEGSGRPVGGTYIESDGTANTASNSYSSFYASHVDSVPGAFGTVLVNNLPNGVRRIEQRSLLTGAVVTAAIDSDGVWPSGVSTVNPAGGATAIALDSTDVVPPTLALGSSSVAFGSTLVAVSARDSVYIRNPGSNVLTVVAEALADTIFAVSPETLTVAAHDSAKLYFSFKPMAVASYSASVVLASNAASTPDTVSVSGNGIVYTVKQVRALATGSTVSFDGVVTRAMGSYVYMQDDSAGIVLYGASGSIHDSIATGYIKGGTRLRVAGTTSAYKNLLEIAVGATKYWTVLGTDTVPSPIPVTLTEISTNGEAYEARLVTVSNLSRADTVSTMWLPATSYYVTATGDTAVSIVVRIPNATDTEVDSSTMPTGTFTFTGAIGQYSSVATTGYELMTINLGDITSALAPVVKVSPAVLNFGKMLLATSATDSTLVKNTGNAVLTVKVGAPSDTTFKVTPDTLTIAAGDSAKLYVTFKPMAVDTFTTTVLLTCNSDAKYDSVRVGGRAYVLTISQVRRTALSSHVAFTGAVTRAMGNYIYMQDDSAGIAVYSPTGSLADSVTAGAFTFGRGLTIAGTTSEYNYLLDVPGSAVATWRFASIDTTGGWLEPISLTLSEIAANGETYEARLVTVSGLTVSTTDTVWTAGSSYRIQDASDTTNAVALRIPSAVSSNVDGTTIPSGKLKFTGILGQRGTAGDSTNGYVLVATNVGDIISSSTDGVSTATRTIPTEYGLSQNYPNPFNPSTRIQFALPKSSPVSLKVYNMLGQEVATLSEGTLEAGTYTVTFDAHALASGMYFYRITAGKYTAVRKMVMVK